MGVEPFLGEVQLCACPYAPKGWAICAGQQLSIQQNQGLFSLLGTNYGGNGTTTFALPNLQGRVPVGVGADIQYIGTTQGQEAVMLSVVQMPAHGHRLRGAGNPATSDSPEGRAPAVGGAYAPTENKTIMGPVVVNSGGSQPHNNVAPSSVLLWCIAMQGIFPSRP